MTVVQTRLPEVEYDLLRKRARADYRPIHDIVRDAIRAPVLTEVVDPNEPIYRELAPRGSRRGRDRTSERVEEILYPPDR